MGGYIRFEREATNLLFQVIAARYERRRIALTANLNLERSLKCLGIN
jgi:DNA replication protein DnaC